MRSLASLMHRSSQSSFSSHEVLDSEQAICSKPQVPGSTMRTPFEAERTTEKVTQVYMLDLSNKVLTTQSAQLSAITTTVQELNLANNLLHQVPQVIRHCTNLRSLNISNNQLLTLPVWMPKLTLDTLIVNDNLLSNDLTYIESLNVNKGLEVLFANGNQIELLAPELFDNQFLKLGLRSNPFISIPFSFINTISKLTFFDLDWFDHCGIDPVITGNVKVILTKLGERAQLRKEVITFSQMYYFFKSLLIDYTILNTKKQSIIFQFIVTDSLGLIKQVCFKQPDLVNQVDVDGVSPLIFALNHKKPRSMALLLKFMQPNSEQVNIALLLAIKRLDIVLITKMIEAGVDINYQSTFEIKSMNKIQIPIASSPMHVVMTSFGRNPSQQTFAFEVLKTLIDSGADANLRNEDKSTPLMMAVKMPSLAAVKAASNYDVFNFQKQDNSKNSPLHIAAQNGLVSILQILQSKQVDPFILNLQNLTAKQVSIASLQVIKSLRKYEYYFLRKKLLSTSENSSNYQKNVNLSNISQTYHVKKQDNQIHNGQRKIFRLNLSQIKEYKEVQSQTMSSQRESQDETINRAFTEICQLIRQFPTIYLLIPSIRQVIKKNSTLSIQMLLSSIVALLIYRHKTKKKLKSSLMPSVIELINCTHFQESQTQISKQIFQIDQQYYNNYKSYVKCMPASQTLFEEDTYEIIRQKQLLSQNLKYDLSNPWKESILESEISYSHSIAQQQWIYSVKQLRHEQIQGQCTSNRAIMIDYETFQHNHNLKIKYMRPKKVDIFREEAVDNSESIGSLSDRMAYMGRINIQKRIVICKPSIVKSSSARTVIDMSANGRSRKSSSQVEQHSGERHSVYQWDISSQQSSKDYDQQL